MQRITVTSLGENVPDGQAIDRTLVIPNGYNKLIRFYFNPLIDYEITLRSQKSKVNILDQFRTTIGTFGMMEIPSDEIADDRYIITMTNKSGSAQTLFVTAMFEETAY